MYNQKLTNKNKNSSKEKLNYTLYYIVQSQFDVSNYYSAHKPQVRVCCHLLQILLIQHRHGNYIVDPNILFLRVTLAWVESKKESHIQWLIKKSFLVSFSFMFIFIFMSNFKLLIKDLSF